MILQDNTQLGQITVAGNMMALSTAQSHTKVGNMEFSKSCLGFPFSKQPKKMGYPKPLEDVNLDQ